MDDVFWTITIIDVDLIIVLWWYLLPPEVY